MTLSPGVRLGTYEIVSPLGAGGMGEVYKAKDTRLARDVAVKVLPEEFFEDEERRTRFEREAKLLAGLNHPNIAAVFSFEEIPGPSPSAARHLLIMELLEGESLRARLEGGALPPRKAVELAVQIANGLAAAHEKGIVHRDLKPENVFVTKEGRVKILDFGLAKLTQREPVADLTSAPTTPPATTAGVVLGTVGYMSPEQVRGEPVDARSDIFAFGAVLYEMLSGKRAFKGASAVETMHAILKDDPPELSGSQSGVSPALDRIVRRCLEKRPEERLQSARDVGFALEAVSGTSGTQPTTSLDSAPLGAWRGRLVAAGIALTAAAVTAGFFAGSRRYRTAVPSFRQLTFRRGELGFARFTPDAQSVVYGAAWEGKPMELFSSRLDGPEARPLGLPPSDLLAVSSTGKMAICLGGQRGPGYKQIGTLAEALLGGGAAREILRDTKAADFSRDGSALAVVHREKGKFRLEYPIGTVLYESQNIIAFPRISPSGDLIAFFSSFEEEGQWALAVVDRSGKKRLLSRGWDPVSGIAWFPGTNEIWFSAGKNAILSLYSIEVGDREELRWQPHGLPGLQDISPDGRFLMSIGSYRSGLISLSPNETKERDLSWFGFSQGGDLSADGTRLLFQEYFGGESGAGTYVRRTDGSTPAVRIGEGEAQALSPDGQWAIAIVPHSPSELLLLPTGAGSRKVVKLPGITCDEVAWFPDGGRVVVQGQEKGRGMRLYVVDLSRGDPKAITPEGAVLGLVSPDGRSVLARAEDRRWLLYPVEGGTPQPVSGIDSTEGPSGWSADGRYLFLHKAKPPNAALFRLDLLTSRRELWKEIVTSDPAGTQIGKVIMARDGHTYAYGYRTSVSDLYLLRGLR